MDSDLNIVYRNPEYHLSHGEVDYEVWEFRTYGHTISDACAQTIASWWHSPGSPLSTVLSTMGAVTSDMEISHFAGQHEFDMSDEREQQELKALDMYIKSKQKGKN
jgi:hypothetical protein